MVKKSEFFAMVFICITIIVAITCIITACFTSKGKKVETGLSQKTNGTDTALVEEENETKRSESAMKNIQWKFKTNGGISSSPICVGDAIYFGSKDGCIYAINTKTKNQIWRYQVGTPILSQVAVYNDMIFFSSKEVFYALNINTGEEIWKYDTKVEDRYKFRKDEWDYHDASPVIDNNVVYFGSGMGFVYGLDILTGKIVWEFKTDKQAAVRSTPLIYEGIMYFGDWNGAYYAVDIKSKQSKWVLNYSKPFQSSSIIADKTIFFGGRDTNIHAVDIVTGQEKWTYKEPAGSWITGDPIIPDKIVYFPTSDEKKVYAMDISTGKVEVVYNIYKNSFSKPLIYNNVLYVTSGDAYSSPGTGKLEAFDLNDNKKSLWEVKMDTGAVFTSPVIANGFIYYGCEDGCLYAVELK